MDSNKRSLSFPFSVAHNYKTQTNQVAPGVVKNRPESGKPPRYKPVIASNGHMMYPANKWYKGIEFQGNTSINPFFYGTYLGETKPGEPVTRTKKQAFQADAVGAAHQLTPSHFNRTHTFRVEWQPGKGGRIDWFSKGHRLNDTFTMEGDGLGEDWVHAYKILDHVLNRTTGAQVPIEPQYLIFNTAVSSTWGFPYDTPDWCEKCYDCDDPKCSCTFAPGFCDMLRDTDVAMYIDSVRVYQSNDDDAHVGAPHTIGCDPLEYPTRGWIKGHEYRYMRNPPFSYEDKHPIRRTQRGGGDCKTDEDCGSHLQNENFTSIFESGGGVGDGNLTEEEGRILGGDEGVTSNGGRGQCIDTRKFKGMFTTEATQKGRLGSKVCSCNPGFTGPNCLAEEHIDDTPSAYDIQMAGKIFFSIPDFRFMPFMWVIVALLIAQVFAVSCIAIQKKRSARQTKSVYYPSPRR